MPAMDQLGSEQVYRPISGAAIASLILAILFGLIVVANGTVGMMQGVPFMLSPWLFLLPSAGTVLAIVAGRQIRRSEGTRAGQPLASWGLWLSVLFGLGYGAYAVGTDFAIRHQVENFLVNSEDGFFAKLKKPDGLNAAFLLTQPPDSRRNLSDRDEQRLEMKFRANLRMFRDLFVVRAIHQGAADTEVVPISVSDLKWDQGGYSLEVAVRVATPEMRMLFFLIVRSQEGPGAGSDKWYVDMTHSRQGPPEEMTDLGRKMMAFRLQSHVFATQWFQKIRDRNIPPDFAPGSKAIKKLFSDGNGRILVDKIFDPDLSLIDIPFQAGVTCCMKNPKAPQQSSPPAYWIVNENNKRLQVAHNLSVRIDLDGEKRAMCMGTIIVERADAEGIGSDPANANWRVIGLEFSSFQVMGSQQGPGQTGA
jgi:hypothetical protein